MHTCLYTQDTYIYIKIKQKIRRLTELSNQLPGLPIHGETQGSEHIPAYILVRNEEAQEIWNTG